MKKSLKNVNKDSPSHKTVKFANKYRIETLRLRNWDYGSNGMYFITICTGNRNRYFGKIENQRVQLSKMGIIADKIWLEISNKFSFIELDQYIVMPNHIHGILTISKDAINRVSTENNTDIVVKNNVSTENNADNVIKTNVSTENNTDIVAKNNVSTENNTDIVVKNNVSTKDNTPNANLSGGITGLHNPMLYDNLSRAIRWYKGRVSYEIRKFRKDFHWQSRFYDIIVRNETSLYYIRRYIRNNPIKWTEHNSNS